MILSMVVVLSATIAFNALNPAMSNPDGAPAGRTGSPGDGGNTCSASSCHSGTPTAATGIISSNVPQTGYIPGTTYTITINTSGSGKKGFQVSPQKVDGTLLGSLIAGSGNKVIGGGKYVTHTAAISSTNAQWTFSWKAPIAGTGDVTFYGAFAITDKATKLSTLTISEAIPLAAPSVSSFAPTSARVDDTILISGTNFKEISSVNIGGVPAKSFVVLSETSISAVVDSCSNGNVEVTNASGTSTLAGFVFIPRTVGVNYSNFGTLKVFPNPSSTQLSIRLNNLEQISGIMIFDLNGKLMLTTNEIDIDISKLAKGNYLVLVRSLQNSYSTRITLQ